MNDSKRIVELLLKIRDLEVKIAWLLSLPASPLDGDAVGDPDPDYVDPWEGYEPYRTVPHYRDTDYGDGVWWEFCRFWGYLGTFVEREQAKAAHNAAIDAHLVERGTKGRSE